MVQGLDFSKLDQLGSGALDTARRGSEFLASLLGKLVTSQLARGTLICCCRCMKKVRHSSEDTPIKLETGDKDEMDIEI